jgi:outer membrane protein assembly factor BamE (lipoprotein component of BamABCDE complex)
VARPAGALNPGADRGRGLNAGPRFCKPDGRQRRGGWAMRKAATGNRRAPLAASAPGASQGAGRGFAGVAGRLARAVLLAAGLAAAAACSPVMRFTGYAPTEFELEALTVGRDTRDTVAEAIGRPGSSGILADGNWYYIQSDWEQRGWRPDREVNRQVVMLSFDSRNVLSNVQRFGLEDGRVVVLSQRVTEDQTQGTSLARQLFRNIGRVAGGPAQPDAGF